MKIRFPDLHIGHLIFNFVIPNLCSIFLFQNYMAIHPIEYRYGSPEMKRIFDEENKLNAMLKVEAALAEALAHYNIIPKESAKIIKERANTRYVKLERVKEIEREIKHDVMAVVKALSEACGEHGRYVHLGATSYDIVDTANMLLIKEAIGIVIKDLKEIKEELKNIAKKTLNLICIGRTHGQHALPITYGFKFANWIDEIDRHIKRLENIMKNSIVGKMSGAVGTYAGFGSLGEKIEEYVMKVLGLKPARISTQVVSRDIYAEIILTLALIAMSFYKFAKEIRNLQRTEIFEISEPFGEKQVGSSTMPHKMNPINSEKICSLARVIKSYAIVALDNISLEHERDLTNSANERIIIPESFILLDEILKTFKYIIRGLKFYPENIKRNLNLLRGVNLAEVIMIELTKRGMNRQDAHELLRKISLEAISKNEDFLKLLVENPIISKYFSKEELEKLLRPENYIGLAKEKTLKILMET